MGKKCGIKISFIGGSLSSNMVGEGDNKISCSIKDAFKVHKPRELI